MSVVACEEIVGTKGSMDARLRREYVRVYRVQTDDTNDGPKTVRLAAKIPRIGQLYATPNETDLGSWCKKLDPVRDDANPYFWTVTAEYDSETEDPEEQKENPLERPPVLRWSFATERKALQVDVDGKKLCNSAGQLFDPPIETDEMIVVLAVTRNVAEFNVAQAIAYENAINSDAFMGVDPYVAKLKGIAAERAFENGVRHWKVGYEIHFRRDGWRLQVLDAGTMQLGYWFDPETGHLGTAEELLPILDPRGGQATKPVPLDGHGHVIAPGAAVQEVYLTKRVLRELPFGTLNLV